MATRKKTTKKTTKKKTKKATSKGAVCKIAGCDNPAMFGITTCLAHGALGLVSSHAAAAQKRGDVISSIFCQVAGPVVARYAPELQERVNAYTQGLPEPQQRLEPEMVEFAARQVGRQAHARVQQERTRRQTTKQQVNPFLLLSLDARTATKADVEAVRKHQAKFYHDDKRPSGAAKDAMGRINAAADLCLAYIAKRDADR